MHFPVFLYLALSLTYCTNWNDSQLSLEGSAEVTQVNAKQEIWGKGSSLKKAEMKVLRHIFTYFIPNFCFWPVLAIGSLRHIVATCQDTCFLLEPPIWSLSLTHFRIFNLLI